MSLRVGLIINPVAGIGGRVGLKGSDGEEIQQQAIRLGAEPMAQLRVAETLESLADFREQLQWFTAGGAMGSELLTLLGYEHQLVYQALGSKTGPDDTVNTVKALQEEGIDLLLFAGGDGTARDIIRGLSGDQLCLGIPAGCKIYSGVFAVTPGAAAEVIQQILNGALYQFTSADVLDIDEQRYRQGQISTRLYGDMLIPETAHYMQNVKVAGRESDDLVKEDIAAWVVDNMLPDMLYLIGSGGICMAIKDQLGIEGTLLGVDAVLDGELLQADATEDQLMTMIEAHPGPVKLILTPIGGQGILFGRGNHTVCHEVINLLGMANTWVVASKSKLKGLNGEPLRLDTGDTDLDRRLSGFIPVITGYEDQVLYQLAAL